MPTFWVDGVPQPQGSKTAFVVKGRAVVVDKNPKLLKPWRAAIASAAREAWAGRPLIDGPVMVTVSFRFVPGESVRREYPSVRPDLDKLLRALMDGIGDAGCVWADDSRVVRVVTEKSYAERAGALVTVQGIEGVK